MTIPPSYGEYPPPPPPAPYGPSGGFYGYPQPRPTNGMAIASLICAFLFAPLGIVFGHVSLSQIRRTGEQGRGLAIAGLVISYLLTVLTVLVVVATIVFAALAVQMTNRLGVPFRPNLDYPGPTGSPMPDSTLPTFRPPATLGSNCQYPDTTEKASKPNTPPRTGRVSTTPATIDATVVTNEGPIGLLLDNAKSPCTVNSFVSLAQQGYFDGTPCHRLTTSQVLDVLQCGDPTGQGTGGPGYRFPNEYPTNQYKLSDPALRAPVVYPRGTLVMANAGSGTNGSQFFVVYRDSKLPPTYTVFGTVDQAGLTVVEEIAAAGVQDGTDDGKPKTNVTIETVR
ncbi:MAG: peptidyl-prolyl cis-trans isomerase, partial [Mycobacterium sp.]|nr:peptidyl-prolyl cis-trans isomerase [Mycobacterium sp.]